MAFAVEPPGAGETPRPSEAKTRAGLGAVQTRASMEGNAMANKDTGENRGRACKIVGGDQAASGSTWSWFAGRKPG